MRQTVPEMVPEYSSIGHVADLLRLVILSHVLIQERMEPFSVLTLTTLQKLAGCLDGTANRHPENQ
jgi:hypothetical protein